MWLEAPAGRKNGWRVENEYENADALIDEIADEIATRRLTFEPIRRYEHEEPTNGKHRILGILSVKQQVCDYVMALALEPFLDARLGFYQVAGVKGKGSKLARSAIRKWSREPGHHTKLDVRKCYDSITHELVMKILRKYIASDDVLYLAETLLATYGVGLEIGSFFALLMAQLVLSYAYHFIEGLHKVRRGKRKALVRHQLWHLDDLLLVGSDKRDLKMAVKALVKFAKDELGLTFKAWKIAKNGDIEPLDIAGYVARNGRVTLRAPLFLRAKRALARFSKCRSLALARRVCSYWGWLKHSRSKGFIERSGARRLKRLAGAIISKCDKRKAGATCTRHAAQPS